MVTHSEPLYRPTPAATVAIATMETAKGMEVGPNPGASSRIECMAIETIRGQPKPALVRMTRGARGDHMPAAEGPARLIVVETG